MNAHISILFHVLINATLARSKRTKNLNPTMKARTCLLHPGFKIKSNREHALITF